MKNFAFLALTGFLLMVLGSCSKSCRKDDIAKASLLRIGTNANFPPFETIDNNGKLVGFDIDVGRALASKLDLKAEFKEFDFDALILALKQGQIDIILSGFSITPSRLKEISMVPYQGQPLTEVALLFWENIPEDLQSFADLKRLADKSALKVSVQAGHYLEDFLKEEHIGVKPLAGPPEQVLDIKYKKSLAAALDVINARNFSVKHPQLKLLVLPLPPEKWDLGYGIGIRKDNLELTKKITAAVTQLKADGSIEAIEKIWVKGGH